MLTDCLSCAPPGGWFDALPSVRIRIEQVGEPILCAMPTKPLMSTLTILFDSPRFGIDSTPVGAALHVLSRRRAPARDLSRFRAAARARKGIRRSPSRALPAR